jgi:hypothetical protein
VRTSNAIELLAGAWWGKFAVAVKPLSAPDIRALLDRLRHEAIDPKGPLPCAVRYLEAMVDDTDGAALMRSWRAALTGLEGLQMYAFDKTKKGQKLKKLTRDARLVAAWQAAAVASEVVTRDVLALLLIDASEASLDALLPHFERARTDPELLRALEDLQRYQSPATTPLFMLVRELLDQQRSRSPVLALGERFGLVSKGRFHLTVTIRAKKPVKRFTYDEVCLTFESDDEPGYFLTRGQETHSPTSSSGWHREVKASLEQLPRALAKVAADANVEWNFEQAITRPLGRAKAAKLLAWLRGAE